MPSYPSSSIRLALSIVSEPNAGLIDAETKFPPAIFSGIDLVVAFAVFDQFDNVVDLSNVLFAEAVFLDDPAKGNVLARSSVAASALLTAISIAAWRDATQAQGKIPFTAAQLAALAADRAWLVVRGLTDAGLPVVWGAGWVAVKLDGVAGGVQMPLLPIPAIVPRGAVYFIPAGVTIAFPTSPTVLGQIICAPGSNGLPPGAFTITAA